MPASALTGRPLRPEAKYWPGRPAAQQTRSGAARLTKVGDLNVYQL
jgi:hypothetical protein